MKKKQMKTSVILFLISILVLGTLTACGNSETVSETVAEVQSATGSGEGYDGEVVVKVTLEGDTITKIEVIESSDTPGLSEGAFAVIIADVLEEQSIEGVDIVSGATGSSGGILAAIEDALSKVQ